jgi:Unconventional myosin tail, actin- and lipid-binding
MENFDQIPRYDTLNLYEKSLQVRQIIGDEELVFYSCEIQKFNRYGFQQDRVLIITNRHMITLEQSTLNFVQHRKLSVNKVNGLTVSKDESSQEIVIHVLEDYDERFNCGTTEHKRNIQNIMFSILKATKVTCILYRVPESKLRKYSTLKSDNEKKNYKRPPSDMIDQHFCPAPDFQFSLIQNAISSPINGAGESLEGADSIVPAEDNVEQQNHNDAAHL